MASKKQPCCACGGSGKTANALTGNTDLRCPICGGSSKADPNVNPLPRFYGFVPQGGSSGAYTFTMAANAAGIKQTFQCDIYDFWAIYILATSNGVPLSNAAAGLFSVTLQDQSTRQWSDFPILSLLTAGYGERPFPLPAPFKISGNGTFTGIFNELSGASNTVQFLLFGYSMIPVTDSVPNPGG